MQNKFEDWWGQVRVPRPFKDPKDLARKAFEAGLQGAETLIAKAAMYAFIAHKTACQRDEIHPVEELTAKAKLDILCELFAELTGTARGTDGFAARMKAARERDKRYFCPNCKSLGFEQSSKDPNLCTFCDGTEGGVEDD